MNTMIPASPIIIYFLYKGHVQYISLYYKTDEDFGVVPRDLELGCSIIDQSMGVLSWLVYQRVSKLWLTRLLSDTYIQVH